MSAPAPLHTSAPVHNLVRLQVEPGSALAWFGPAGAALAGALASGRLGLDAPSLLFLLLTVLLADPLLGGLWTVIVSTDWGAPWRPLPQGEGEPFRAATVSLPTLPHTVAGSPAHRLGERLSRGLGHWREAAWPQLSRPLLQAGFFLAVSLAVAAVLGPGVALLVVASLSLALLRALMAHYWEGDYRSLAALYHFGLAWWVGCVALSGLQTRADSIALLLATAYTLTYYGYLVIRSHGLPSPAQPTTKVVTTGPAAQVVATNWGLVFLNGGQILGIIILVMAYCPWQAGVVGLLLLVQGLWQPRLWRDGDGGAYLRGTLVWLVAAILVAFA